MKTFFRSCHRLSISTAHNQQNQFQFLWRCSRTKKLFYLLIQKVLKIHKFFLSSIIWYRSKCGVFFVPLLTLLILFRSACTHLDTTKLFLNHADLGLSHTLNLLCFPFLHINHSVPKLLLSLLMRLNRWVYTCRGLFEKKR